ncbi:MAG: hypothetical protein B6245_23390 [Desulfobacteraceae bacterium 4572_88]|nr:MAG: hypothetical protein B6245_23390 [Desulfobacteraceae bacterium 4572_88]
MGLSSINMPEPANSKFLNNLRSLVSELFYCFFLADAIFSEADIGEIQTSRKIISQPCRSEIYGFV